MEEKLDEMLKAIDNDIQNDTKTLEEMIEKSTKETIKILNENKSLKQDKELWEQWWHEKCQRLQQENTQLKEQLQSIKTYCEEEIERLPLLIKGKTDQYFESKTIGKVQAYKNILNKLGEEDDNIR